MIKNLCDRIMLWWAIRRSRQIKDGCVNSGLSDEFVRSSLAHFGAEAVKLLEDSGGVNYVRFHFSTPETGKRRVIMTLQWADGLSPDEKIELMEDILAMASEKYEDVKEVVEKSGIALNRVPR